MSILADLFVAHPADAPDYGERFDDRAWEADVESESFGGLTQLEFEILWGPRRGSPVGPEHAFVRLGGRPARRRGHHLDVPVSSGVRDPPRGAERSGGDRGPHAPLVTDRGARLRAGGARGSHGLASASRALGRGVEARLVPVGIALSLPAFVLGDHAGAVPAAARRVQYAMQASTRTGASLSRPPRNASSTTNA